MVTLSVDDQQPITEHIRWLMSRIDPKGTHLTAYSVPQAIEVLQRYHVGVVFLDIEMPGINGIEAARQFLELSARQRFR